MAGASRAPGAHTHRGVPALMATLPHLPGNWVTYSPFSTEGSAQLRALPQKGRGWRTPEAASSTLLCSVPALLLAGLPGKLQFLYHGALPWGLHVRWNRCQDPLATLVYPRLSIPEAGGSLFPKDLINEPSIPGREATRPRFSSPDTCTPGPRSGDGVDGVL